MSWESGDLRRVLLFITILVLLLVPSNVYLAMMGGGLGILGAQTLVLLFAYVCRYMGADLTKPEVFALYYALSFMGLSYNAYPLLYMAYLRESKFTNNYLVRGYRLADLLPTWLSPPRGSPVYECRTLFHPHMLLPLAISLMFSALWLISELSLMMMASFLYVEVENLRYPLAAVDAAFVSAISERTTEWLRYLLPSTVATFILALIAYMPITPTVGGPLIPLGFIDFSPQVAEFLPGAAVGLNLYPSFFFFGAMLNVGVAASALVTSIVVWILLNSLFITNPTLRSIFPEWAQEYERGMQHSIIVERATLRLWLPFQMGSVLALSLILLATHYRSISRALKALSRAAAASARGYPRLTLLLMGYLIPSATIGLMYLALLPDLPPYLVLSTTLGLSFFLALVNGYLQGEMGLSLGLPPHLWEMMIYSLPKGSLSPATQVATILYAPPIAGTLTGSGSQALKVASMLGVRPTELIKVILIAYALGSLANILMVEVFWRLAPIPSMVYPNTMGMRLNAIHDCLRASMQLPLRPDRVALATAVFLAVYGGAQALSSFLHLPISTAGIAMGLVRYPADMIPVFLGSLLGRLLAPRILSREVWEKHSGTLVAGAFLGEGIAVSIYTLLSMMGRAGWTWPW
ncbi:MAG: hypothetical protein DRK00_07145 [Thermoprotei archaeon]|nr:MAG: hypothetical protein DRK00_07145 [Thermoprotei archaeon]